MVKLFVLNTKYYTSKEFLSTDSCFFSGYRMEEFPKEPVGKGRGEITFMLPVAKTKDEDRSCPLLVGRGVAENGARKKR